MATERTATRHDESGVHSIYTRSDGEVFHLWRHEDGHASLLHNNAPPPNGIDLGVSIGDKFAAAQKRVLEYPDGWP